MEMNVKAKSKKSYYEKTIVVPVQKHMWQAIRKISYDTEISMSELARIAIQKLINKHQPDVDNDKQGTIML